MPTTAPSLTGTDSAATQLFTLLCIDDDLAGLKVRKLLLEHCGFEVLTAENGRDGLELLGEHKVHLVILDYRMPEMDGAMTAIEIKRAHPGMPIIMYSGFPEEVPQVALLLVESCISKADGPALLLNEIKRYLPTQSSPNAEQFDGEQEPPQPQANIQEARKNGRWTNSRSSVKLRRSA